MMLDIDGILTRYEATTTDVLAAAQALATSAIGDLVNKSHQPSAISHQTSDSLHRAADAIAEQIREALHQRIDEGEKPDW
jgi:hypothetical protein